jgi:hypothetical protein
MNLAEFNNFFLKIIFNYMIKIRCSQFRAPILKQTFVRGRDNHKQSSRSLFPNQFNIDAWNGEKDKIVFLHYYQPWVKDQIDPKLTIKPLKSSFKSYFLKK